jgi:DNA-binding NarL/FixJ family response regulator
MYNLILISSDSSFRKVFSALASYYPGLISNVYTLPAFLEEFHQRGRNITIVDEKSLNNSEEALISRAKKCSLVIVKEDFASGEVGWLIKSGIKGLVGIVDLSNRFAEVISIVMSGKVFLGSSQVKTLFEDIRGTLDYDVLSAREREILPKIVRGRTSVQIANELGVSYETIKSHSKNIYRKLRIKSKSELLKHNIF